MDLCVCGFHIYCDIWKAAEGEVLECKRETSCLRGLSQPQKYFKENFPNFGMQLGLIYISVK